MPPASMFQFDDDKELIYGADKNLATEDDLLMEDEVLVDRACPMVVEFDMLEDEASMLFILGRLTSLGTALILLNLCRSHGTSSLFISELFTILTCSILPSIDSLPKTEYEASKRLKMLGLDYETIHMCLNNYMLFRRNDSRDLEACSKCNAPQYKKVGETKVPLKVLRYFSLIPRLQRMFATPLMVSFQTWYIGNLSIDGLVRHVANSWQWKEVNKIDPSFTTEHHNLRLGLAIDGVNPFSIKGSMWST